MITPIKGARAFNNPLTTAITPVIAATSPTPRVTAKGSIFVQSCVSVSPNVDNEAFKGSRFDEKLLNVSLRPSHTPLKVVLTKSANSFDVL